MQLQVFTDRYFQYFQNMIEIPKEYQAIKLISQEEYCPVIVNFDLIIDRLLVLMNNIIMAINDNSFKSWSP